MDRTPGTAAAGLWQCCRKPEFHHGVIRLVEELPKVSGNTVSIQHHGWENAFSAIQVTAWATVARS